MNSFFKKLPFIALVALLLLLTSSVVMGQDEEVTLRIIEKNPEWAPFWEEVIPMFEEEYPYITIQHEAVTTGEYNQLLTARLASNDVDIAIGERRQQAATSSQREQWLPLNDQAYLDNFSPDVIALGTVDGNAYLVPTGVVGNVVFYNVDLFEELELEVPQTWTEFLEVAQAIEDAGYAPIIVGAGDTWPVNMIVNALEGPIVQGSNPDFYTDLRAGEVSFDEGPWTEVIDKVNTLSQYFQEFATGTPYDSVVTLFVSGTGAMMIDGAWQAGLIDRSEPDFEVGVFAMPATDDVEQNNVVTTKMATGYMINANSPHIEEAHLFLEFFSRADIYQRFIDVSGLIPAQEEIVSSGEVASLVADFFATTPQIPEWPDLRIPGADYSNPPNVIRMILGELTPAEVSVAMQEKLISSQDNWQD